jgi:phosphoribosylamine---glycine ligase
MNILLVGSGGREHALAWSLAQTPHAKLHMAPGNPGMAALGTCYPDIKVNDIKALLDLARQLDVDLTVVGPELPLSLGLVDEFEAEGLAVFGPSQAAARLEASKAFAKAVMLAAGVPTGHYRHLLTEADALSALNEFIPPYVIKEDGLAAGKGVTVTPDNTVARQAIQQAFAKGMTVVIESFLPGEELSVLALCDGKMAIPLVAAQDFKRAYDNDQGPNTGGMGAYAPVPWASPYLMAQIQQRVLQPVLREMAQRGTPYKGVLYAGLMIAPDGTPNVIEFNARFGDPETQVVLPLLAEPLYPLLMAAAKGDLSPWQQQGVALAKNKAAVTVVLAAKGYPASPETGDAIVVETDPDDTQVLFHAGTLVNPLGQLVTAGGRVLNATGFGSTLAAARLHAYALANQVKFAGKHCRQDIAQHAMTLV